MNKIIITDTLASTVGGGDLIDGFCAGFGAVTAGYGIGFALKLVAKLNPVTGTIVTVVTVGCAINTFM